MKRFYQLAAFLLLLPVMFFIACSEDEETPEPQPATVLFNPDIDPFEGVPGDIASTTVSVSAPDGLNALIINKTVGDGTAVEYDRATPAAAGDFVLTYEFEYTLLEAEIGETVYFDFEVDHDGTAFTPKTITVTTISPPARSYTAILLDAPLGDRTSGTFFSSVDGLIYSAGDVIGTDGLSATIDFGYYYLQTTGASLTSPSAYPSAIYDLGPNGQNWGTLNTSNFKSTTLDQAAFNEIVTYAEIDAAYEGGTDVGAQIQQLSVGDVIAFSTDTDKNGGTKMGVLFVTKIEEGFGENDYIEIEVLIQEPTE